MSYNDELALKCQIAIEEQVSLARLGEPMAFIERMFEGEMRRCIYETVSYAGRDPVQLAEYTKMQVVFAIQRIRVADPDRALVIEWRRTPVIESVSDQDCFNCYMRLALHDESWMQFGLGADIVKREGVATELVA